MRAIQFRPKGIRVYHRTPEGTERRMVMVARVFHRAADEGLLQHQNQSRRRMEPQLRHRLRVPELHRDINLILILILGNCSKHKVHGIYDLT